MSLASNILDLATRVATETKSLRTLLNGNQPTNAALLTTAKGNLVAAINELYGSIGNAGAQINDGVTNGTTTWSSTKTQTQINIATAALVDAAPGTLDTLNELAAALGDDANFATTINTALGNRVRFDAAQTLTTAQQIQARANIGAGTGNSNVVIGTGAGQAADAAALATSLSGKAATAHTHTASQISDGSTVGKAVLTAADAAAARSAIGAGTGNSNLAIGTTTGTAADAAVLATSLSGKAATAHTHAAGDVASGTFAAARLPAATETAIGAVELATTAEATTGTDTSRAVTPAGLKIVADTKAATTHGHALTDAGITGVLPVAQLPGTTVGKAVLAAVDAAAARTAIGAASAADVGDTSPSFVDTFEAGLL